MSPMYGIPYELHGLPYDPAGERSQPEKPLAQSGTAVVGWSAITLIVVAALAILWALQ